MATTTVTLIGAAKIFDVHPRTIVRAISGQHNTYWYEDINEDVFAVKDIAEAYGMSPAELGRCLEGRDKLIKPDEAAVLLGIQPRTFRDRVQAGKYRKVTNGGVVRYLRSKIIADKIARE